MIPDNLELTSSHMAKLFIFNCSNDMALASGASEYMPPKSVARMEEMYAHVPMFVADEDDVAVSPQELCTHDGFSELCSRLKEPITEICPWGWSKPIRNRLLRFGVPETMLPDEQHLETLRNLSSREFGVCYAELFYAEDILSAIQDSLVGNHMRFIGSEDEMNLTAGTYIAKIPWSSSGRGNRIFTFRQGDSVPVSKYPILIDRFYDKVLDFAMEFYVGADATEYLGLSVFKADKEGRYEQNYVESQIQLAERIRQALGYSSDETETLLSRIREIHRVVLNSKIVGRYKGPLGIDMMVVNDGGTMKVHPVVELNFRMNMGIMALKTYEKYGDRFPVVSLEVLAAKQN